MTFFRHGDASNGGAVRAAPIRSVLVGIAAGARGRQTKKTKKILNLEPPRPIL
jgi:hypothetical protein